jgi:catechol 2,3-dioxygenase-like lactoylglutathione lyase family enzyme
MLGNARIAAIVPVSDLERAIEFYGSTLGLRLIDRNADLPDNPEAVFEAGGGTIFVYKSTAAGQGRATEAGFMVDDLDAAMAEMRERGVIFEDYDVPGLKTENGVASIAGNRAAWFKDPDGNILAVEQRSS